MPRIPEEIIERIKEASDIVEIVSEYVPLKKTGRNYSGICPFHNEKTPSFSVNSDLQIYKCFGCGAGGNVFKFIQEMDRVSFVEAVGFLGKRCGIGLPEREAEQSQEGSDRLYQANELAQKYYHHLLRQPEGRDGLAYFRSRDLQDETIDRFGLGYCPSEWDSLLQIAGRRGFKPQILEKAGLALPRRNSSGFYDRFRERIAFPIANPSGRTVAFGARALKDGQDPKYLNSSESPIYRKSAILYGLDQAREAIRQKTYALVVEGYMDVVTLSQHGVYHVVASSGTALTAEHCRLLARYTRQVILVFDGDSAGSTAALRGFEVILGTDLDVRVVSLPADHDPDSWVAQEGPEVLYDAIEKAHSALDFHLEQLAKQWDLSTLTGKTRAAEAVKPLLAQTRDPVRRDLLLREIAQRLSIDEIALRQDLRQTRQRPHRSDANAALEDAPAKQQDSPGFIFEKEFLGLLLNNPQFIGPTAAKLAPAIFLDERSNRLAALLFDKYREAETLDIGLLISEVEDDGLVRLISDCAMQEFGEVPVDQQWEERLVSFARKNLSQRIGQIMQALKTAKQTGDEAAQARLVTEQSELIKQKQALTITST
jgi:DNA primase